MNLKSAILVPVFCGFTQRRSTANQVAAPAWLLILHDATEARQKTFEAIESERIRALTLLAASVAHEIGNRAQCPPHPSSLLERELKKLKPTTDGLNRLMNSVAPRGKARPVHSDGDISESLRKLENYVAVAKGEIIRLDAIVTQFLQAIRPSPPQLKPGFLNDVALETLELLRPGSRTVDLMSTKIGTPPARCDDGFDPDETGVSESVRNAMQAMTKGGTLTVQTGSGPDAVLGEHRADYGRRDSAGEDQSHLRAFLHDQAKRNRPGFDDRAANCARSRREDRVGEPRRQGNYLSHLAALREKIPRLLEARLHD